MSTQEEQLNPPLRYDDPVEPSHNRGIPSMPRGVVMPQQTRTTLILKLYHQLPQYDPVGPQIPAYTEVFTNEEQPYQRRMRVGEEWTPIDFGWTGDTGCAILCLRNEYKSRRTVQPTVEEEQEDLMHVLEIGKIITAMRPFLKEGDKDYVEPLLVLYVGQPVVLSVVGQTEWVIRRTPAGGQQLNDGQYLVFCVPSDSD